MAAFRNVGQSCSAPTRMLVPEHRLAEVERLAAATAESIVVGDPASERTVLGPVANRAQFHRVQEMIQAGIAEGAKVVCGGPGRAAPHTRGFYVRPTIFSEVDTGMRVQKFTPNMDEATREKLYKGWKKAVTRARDWEEAEA